MSVQLLREYAGRWNRKLTKTKGFYDWVWEDGPNGRRPARVYDSLNVQQSLELRLSLWGGAWFADPAHGPLYLAGEGHLGRKFDKDARDLLRMDLIRQTFKDRRIKELLATPEPEIDEDGHVTATIRALTVNDEEIEANVSAYLGEPG